MDFYRYIDCTELTRVVIDFIRETIETELPAGLRYLTVYDQIRTRIRDIVDMPDRHADLLITSSSHETLARRQRTNFRVQSADMGQLTHYKHR